MSMELGIWRIDGDPRRIRASMMPSEERLETLIEEDSTILGEPLLIIGRQVTTDHGKVIDLLAVDAAGALHVLELKRDRTPRDAVAQVLDYATWVEALTHEQVVDIFEDHHPDQRFEAAFDHRFGISPPEDLNTQQFLTIVASRVDPATARIVEYLAGFDIPLNVLFFNYFVDDDREFLARSWLVDESQAAADNSKKMTRRKETWNGRDWYISFGDGETRSWSDARRFGFIAAGGGAWYSRTLRNLPIGARVFVCIPGPGNGYVGVGTATGEAVPFGEAEVEVDGQRRHLAELDLEGNYRHDETDPDLAEYIVPVEWISTLDRTDAIWEKGFFANQNSACKLRNRFTLERLTERFSLQNDAS